MTATCYVVTLRSASHARRAGRGFTLLELLIAAALSSVLLAVVWHTLATHSRLYEKRGEATARALVARAVRYQFLSDLDHLVRTPVTNTRQSATADNLPGSFSYGLRGDRRSLEISILEPVWQSAEPESPAESDRTDSSRPGETRQPSPIRTVRYQFVGAMDNDDTLPGSLSQVVVDAIEQEADRDQTAADGSQHELLDDESTDRDASESAAPSTGLLREVHGDRPQQAGPDDRIPAFSETPHAPTTASLNAPLTDPALAAAEPSANVIVDRVPEIEHLEFRYFDGQRWHGHWDSSVSGTLPAAVEMSFELAQPEGPRHLQRRRPQHRRRDGNQVRTPQPQTASHEPSHILRPPLQETNTVFRSLAFIRAARRLTPPSTTVLEEAP